MRKEGWGDFEGASGPGWGMRIAINQGWVDYLTFYSILQMATQTGRLVLSFAKSSFLKEVKAWKL